MRTGNMYGHDATFVGNVVEVSPPYDQAEVTAYLGNRVVLEALPGIAWRRRLQAGEVVRQPDDPLLEHRRPAAD